jgi:hypothetical protein
MITAVQETRHRDAQELAMLHGYSVWSTPATPAGHAGAALITAPTVRVQSVSILVPHRIITIEATVRRTKLRATCVYMPQRGTAAQRHVADILCDHLRHDGRPHILLGDFNGATDVFARTLFRTAASTSGDTRPTWCGFGGRRRLQLDFVATQRRLSGGFARQTLSYPTASDHAMVSVDLSLRWCRTPVQPRTQRVDAHVLAFSPAARDAFDTEFVRHARPSDIPALLAAATATVSSAVPAYTKDTTQEMPWDAFPDAFPAPARRLLIDAKIICADAATVTTQVMRYQKSLRSDPWGAWRYLHSTFKRSPQLHATITADEFCAHFALDLCKPAPTSSLPPIYTPRGMISDAPFTSDEVRRAAAGFNNHRAPGPDGLPSEVWKQPSTHATVAVLLNDIVDGAPLHDSMRSCLIVPLFKGKGNAKLPSGYRPIVLLPTLLKLLHKLVLHRIRAGMEDIILLYQAAFRHGLCTSMHVASLCELMARARAGGHHLFMCFADFANAYSSVRRDALFNMLNSIGVPPKLLALLQRTHAEVSLRVRWNGQLSRRTLSATAGVLQGDPLAPYLFILVMDSILRALKYEAGALCDWRVQLRLPCLAYADDVVLLSNSFDGLRDLLATFERDARAWGLHLNTSSGKTEWMRVPVLRRNPPRLTCVAGDVAHVHVYKYLGVLLTAGAGAWRDDLRRRLQLIQASMARSVAIWQAPVPAAVKAHLAAILLLPILEFGLISYPVTPASIAAVHRATSAVLRRAYGIRIRWDAPAEHTHTETLYEFTPFSVVTWAASVLSAFGHWARVGQRAGILHPVILTCAGATVHESPFTVRAALTALGSPADWSDIVRLALEGGKPFRDLVHKAQRARFKDVLRDVVLTNRLVTEDHAPVPDWTALWRSWKWTVLY